MNIHHFANTEEYAKSAADAIESFISSLLGEKKIIRVALSGGSGPIAVYRELVQRHIPWSRIALFLVDERYVPLNSKESNFGMIQRELVDKVKNLRRFYHYNTRDDIPTIMDQYEKTLRQFESPLFDLVILGMGSDGHTASLFPQTEALHEQSRLVVHTVKTDKNSQDRLSLTFPAILDSQKIIFLIQGAEKASVVDNLINGNQSVDDLPAKGVMEHGDVGVFFDESV